MAIYWIDPVGGNDGNGGTDPDTDAVKTVPVGLALLASKGDILNLLNTGDHTWPVAGETIFNSGTGTSWSDPGFIIRGRTAADAAAMATIASTGGVNVRRIIHGRAGCGWNIIENIIFDASATAADASDHSIYRARDAGQGPVQFRYCAVIGGASGTLSGGDRTIYEVDTAAPSPEQFYIHHCYMQNCKVWVGVGYTGANIITTMHNVCAIVDVDGRSGRLWAQGALTADRASAVNQFYNNTFYEEVSSAATAIPGHYDFQPATTKDAGQVDIYSNFHFIESDKVAAPIGGSTYTGAVGSTDVDHTGTIGYNVFVHGPSIIAGDLATAGTYQLPWDPDDDDAAVDDPDIYATDTRVFETAPATVFYDPTSAYQWVMPNDLEITILKDLRPILYKTAGLLSVTPGALPAGETDYTVSIIADTLAPEVEDTVNFTITISNSGINATDVETTITIPSGLTYISNTPSAGTYASGVWTLPSLPDGASETLLVVTQVDTGEEGSTLTFTAEQTDGNPDTDSDSTDNTDSVVLTVFMEDPGSFNDPSNIPYLDQYPLRAEIWKMSLNSALRTTRNRNRRHYMRKDRELRFMRELSVRRLEVAPSTTTELSLGGIEYGRYLIMESTEQVELSVSTGNTADNWTAPATFVLIGDSDFETVAVRNPSATATATVTIGVTD